MFLPLQEQVCAQLSFLRDYLRSSPLDLLSSPFHLVVACDPWLTEEATDYFKGDLGFASTDYERINKNDAIYPMYFCFERDLHT